jgi:hypothetical protein
MKIRDTKDVSKFVNQLVRKGICFHPDDDFRKYVQIKSRRPTYTLSEAARLNRINQACFDFCNKAGINYYDFALDKYLKQTGLIKLIPSPYSRVAMKQN